MTLSTKWTTLHHNHVTGCATGCTHQVRRDLQSVRSGRVWTAQQTKCVRWATLRRRHRYRAASARRRLTENCGAVAHVVRGNLSRTSRRIWTSTIGKSNDMRTNAFLKHLVGCIWSNAGRYSRLCRIAGFSFRWIYWMNEFIMENEKVTHRKAPTGNIQTRNEPTARIIAGSTSWRYSFRGFSAHVQACARRCPCREALWQHGVQLYDDGLFVADDGGAAKHGRRMATSRKMVSKVGGAIDAVH